MTYLQPNSATMPAATSPVWAPCAYSLTFCAPQRIVEPDNAAWACHKYGNGTQTAISRIACAGQRARRSASSASFRRKSPFIFQLPTTSLPGMGGQSTEDPGGTRPKPSDVNPPGTVGSTRCGATFGPKPLCGDLDPGQAARAAQCRSDQDCVRRDLRFDRSRIGAARRAAAEDSIAGGRTRNVWRASIRPCIAGD